MVPKEALRRLILALMHKEHPLLLYILNVVVELHILDRIHICSYDPLPQHIILDRVRFSQKFLIPRFRERAGILLPHGLPTSVDLVMHERGVSRAIPHLEMADKRVLKISQIHLKQLVIRAKFPVCFALEQPGQHLIPEE